MSNNSGGEIPLYPGEPCDLGAMNLSAFVKTKHVGLDGFDMDGFKRDVSVAVRFLDNVLEVNRFALPDNEVMSQKLRRIGLGIMGLADALILMGYRYDTPEGRDAAYTLTSTLREFAVKASQDLARERGPFPLYDKSTLDIARRHVACVTVAPTGTTSMLMGTSGGVEPIFSPFIYRKIGGNYEAMVSPIFKDLLESNDPHEDYRTQGDDGYIWDWVKVTDALQDNHGSLKGLPFIPPEIADVFVCAHDIAPRDHVLMQATVQRAFDDGNDMAANSISKTINLPNDASVDDVLEAYELAFDEGAKGITVYRDGSRGLQVLNTTSKTKDEAKKDNDDVDAGNSTPNTAERCPLCSTQLVSRDGCETCLNSDCGYSKCETSFV